MSAIAPMWQSIRLTCAAWSARCPGVRHSRPPCGPVFCRRWRVCCPAPPVSVSLGFNGEALAPEVVAAAAWAAPVEVAARPAVAVAGHPAHPEAVEVPLLPRPEIAEALPASPETRAASTAA